MYNEDLQELQHLAERVNHHRLEFMGLRSELETLKAEVATLKADLEKQTSRVTSLTYWSN